MKGFKVVFGLVFLNVLTSCASTPSEFVGLETANHTEAVIYIYRPASMSNILIDPEVLINNEKISDIKNDSYLTSVLPAGQYTVKLKLAERYAGKQSIDLKVGAAESVFLRVNTTLKFEMNKPYSRSFSIERVDKEKALLEIQYTQNAAIEKSSKKTKEVATDKNEEDVVHKDQFSIHKTRNPFSK